MRMISLPLRKIVLIGVAAAALACASTVQAQQKIAIVDMKKIFDGYYKTKQGTARLQEDGEAAKKALQGMYEDYQKANEEHKKLIDSTTDPVISSEERERRKKSAESKLLDLQDIERSIAQFNRDTTERLELQKRRMRDEIIRKIREVVNSRARAGSYSLVLDVSGESINQVPVVLFSSGQDDMTDGILGEMNAGAPPGILDAPAPAATTTPVSPVAPDKVDNSKSKKK